MTLFVDDSLLPDRSEYFANAIRTFVGSSGSTFGGERLTSANVFSEATPDRTFDGSPTVELTESSRVRKKFIDGRVRDVVTLSVLIRTRTKRAALLLTETLRVRVVAPTARALVASGTLDDWTEDDDSVVPDVVGLEVGASFFGAVDFTLYEKARFEDEERL